MTADMTIKALASWYGSNRLLAANVGSMLGPRAWVGVPFAGGCCELPHIKTRAGVANDLHRHLINLARVVRDPILKAELARRLSLTLCHADELKDAQARCRNREASAITGLFAAADEVHTADIDWAFDYFICSWVGTSARSGKNTEFNTYFAVRWTSSGGASSTRFRNAIASIDAWHKALLSWEFTTLDAFEFIAKCRDEESHGLYIDAPWPDAGVEYRHSFTDEQQRKLAIALKRFTKTRIVVRFGDHPFIRDLYPDGDHWAWHRHTSRSQANGEVEEVLIVNREAYK